MISNRQLLRGPQGRLGRANAQAWAHSSAWGQPRTGRDNELQVCAHSTSLSSTRVSLQEPPVLTQSLLTPT